MGILMRNEINYSGNGSSSPSTTTSLSNLTDVEITSLANGQGLFYNEELQKWVNGDITNSGTSGDNTSTYEASIDYVDITLTSLDLQIVGEYPIGFNIDNCIIINTFLLDSNGKPSEMFPKSTYDIASLGRPYQYVKMSTNGVEISTNVESLLNRTCRVFLMKKSSVDTSTTGTLKPWLYDSENEVVIGVYNGKPLYRKTTHIVSDNEVEIINWDVSDLNIDVCVSVKTTVKLGSQGAYNWITSPHIANTAYYVTSTHMASSKIVEILAKTYALTEAYGTIEYTKTTDAEGSGAGLMPYGVGGGSSLINYSTEEQIVGKWMGKTLYQKSYDSGDMQPNASKLFLLDDTIKHLTHNLIKVDGTWVIGSFDYSEESVSQTSLFMKAKFQETYQNAPDVYINPNGLYIHLNHTDYGCRAYVTIQYTKTTDSTT